MEKKNQAEKNHGKTHQNCYKTPPMFLSGKKTSTGAFFSWPSLIAGAEHRSVGTLPLR